MSDSRNGEEGEGEGDWNLVSKGKGKDKKENQNRDGNNNNRGGAAPSTSTRGHQSYGNGNHGQNQSQGGYFNNGGRGRNYPSTSRGGAGGFQNHQQQRPYYNSGGNNTNNNNRGGKTPASNSNEWTFLPEQKDDIKLPASKGPVIHSMRQCTITTNHFPSPINLPDELFHYEISITRKRDGDSTSSNCKPSTSTSPKMSKSSGDEDGNKSKQNDNNDEKKLPAELRMGIIKKYIMELEEQLNENLPINTLPIKLISDYSNTLNSYINLNIQADPDPAIQKEINIQEIPNYDSAMGTGIFIVTLNPTQGNFRTAELNQYMNDLRNLPEHLEEGSSLITRVEQVYNTLLKNVGGNEYVPAGRASLVKISGGETNEIGKGLEALEGASVIYNMGCTPTVNIDLQHRPYIKSIQVSEYLEQNGLPKAIVFQNATNWKVRDMSTAKRLLKDIKVNYGTGRNLQSKGGKIMDITPEGASTTQFEKDGNLITIEEHFKKEFGTRLVYPDAICLILNKGKVKIPLELCKIKKGQSFNKKLEADQTSEIMRYSRNNPTQLKEKIDKEVKSLRLATDETLKSFGATFNPTPVMFKSTRILVPPKIIYGGNNANPNKVGIVTPDDGTWDLGNLKFIEPAKKKTWGVVNLSPYITDKDPSWKNFESVFDEMASDRGLDIGKSMIGWWNVTNKIFEKNSSKKNQEELIKVLKEAKEVKHLDFLMVIIPQKGSCIYDQVKRAAELDVGILTQCITSSNIQKCNRSTIANLLLKLNMKLNGINNFIGIPSDEANQLDFTKVPCLFLGADVTHPPPDHNVKPGWTPSFAAITSNIQHTGLPTAMKIQAQVKPDKGAAEVINNLDTIAFEFLNTYKQNMDYLPHKIIYFRDGVGDGQFKEVIHVEMRDIRKACSRFNVDGNIYEPEITFIVVQKRHKTRAYCSTGRYENGKPVYDNCEAGTVIDQDIVHRKDKDFYLFSHKGMLGTSRSTHYRAIWDDTGFTMDQIEYISYDLCHMYARCNRAVRVPAPALYAHLAASRAKVLYDANTVPVPFENTSDGRGDQATDHVKIQHIAAINDKLKIHPAFRNEFPMHYI